jgi:hypothetical protein
MTPPYSPKNGNPPHRNCINCGTLTDTAICPTCSGWLKHFTAIQQARLALRQIDEAVSANTDDYSEESL